MSNYFQKITSRSGVLAADGNKSSQYILPDKPSLFRGRQNNVVKDEDPQPGLIDDPAAVIPAKPALLKQQNEAEVNLITLLQPKQEMQNIYLPKDHQASPANNQNSPENVQQKYILQPVRDTSPGFKKNEQSHIDTVQHPITGNNIVQPPVSIIEKITQRNFQNKIVENERTEIRLVSEAKNDILFSTVISPTEENIHEKKESRSRTDKRPEKGISAVKEILQPAQPSQKVKEQLVPVQKDNTSFSPMKRPVPNNKLIIGRLTVKVINPAPQPAKGNVPPTRQNNIQKASNIEFTGINKLSFGLGQL